MLWSDVRWLAVLGADLGADLGGLILLNDHLGALLLSALNRVDRAGVVRQ